MILGKPQMIIYLASYPRSGNSWLQSFLGNQFRRLPTAIHGSPQNAERLKEWVYWAENVYKLTIHPGNEDNLPSGLPLPENQYVIYSPMESPEEKHLTLSPGFVVAFTDQVRKSLAKADENYIVKTHFHPYSEYYQGEIVIHIVRHPGACLYSLFRFFVDVREFDLTLEDVIQGSQNWGNWSDYQNQWLEAADRLGDRLLQINYEQVFENELGICEQISRTIGLPIINHDMKSFEYYHQLRPNITREGKRAGWEENYSSDQLTLLLNQHREVMEKLGYSDSDTIPE